MAVVKAMELTTKLNFTIACKQTNKCSHKIESETKRTRKKTKSKKKTARVNKVERAKNKWKRNKLEDDTEEAHDDCIL